MKPAFIYLILIAGIFSCKAQKQQLEFNLTKGKVYYQKMNVEANINQSVNGQQINISMVIGGRMAYKILDVKDTVYKVDVKYESLSMKMVMPNGTMEFSSEKKGTNDIMSNLLGTLTNRSFEMTLTKTGKIMEVRNIDSLFVTMFDQFPQIPEAQKQQIRSQVMQAYGDKAFKGNMEMTSAIFPGHLVSKGDKWTSRTILESSMSANVETVYELLEISDNFYLIKGDSKIFTTDKEAKMQANGMAMKYNLKGTMVSEIKIDKNTGWTIAATINQELSGNVQIMDNPNMPDGATVPMLMKTRIITSEK